MERLTWLDRMRGLAIMSVVIQHLTNGFGIPLIYLKWIACTNMGVFFFVSGYVMAYTENSVSFTFKGALRFIYLKTVQLILPLIMWDLVVDRYFLTTKWRMLTLNDVMLEWSHTRLWFLLTLYGIMCLLFFERIIPKKFRGEFLVKRFYGIGTVQWFGNRCPSDCDLFTLFCNRINDEKVLQNGGAETSSSNNMFVTYCIHGS